MPIDFVITWVDGSDKKWIAEYNKYTIKKIDECRYRDWGLLKYWFRAVEKNAPWVNKIYFVTWGHIPEWLNTSCEKIVIVNHKDFIDNKYLPTFNSCAIELNLHKIKDLSEKFVYFNDDMFINNITTPNDFFVNDLPCDRKNIKPIWFYGKNSTLINFNCSFIVNNYYKTVEKNGKMMFFNNMKNIIKSLILGKKKRIIGYIPDHVPTSFLKSTFLDLWNKENITLTEVCGHKFREKTDVSQWLFQFWQIASGKYYERNEKISKYYEISSVNLDSYIEEIKLQNFKLICLNDGDSTDNYEINKKKLINLFETLYPEKSNFEK